MWPRDFEPECYRLKHALKAINVSSSRLLRPATAIVAIIFFLDISLFVLGNGCYVTKQLRKKAKQSNQKG